MNEDSLQEVGARFAALWRVLSYDGNRPRPPDETHLLIDQVRDALDRRRHRLDRSDTALIANSFAVDRLMHEGAIAQIHRIRHCDLHTTHALKSLRPDKAHDVVARDLLQREARFGLGLRHRHIAATEMLLRLPDGRPALVLEWLPVSLAERLEAGIELSAADIRAMLSALLAGLACVHAAGLVHADIAPENLLFKDQDMTQLKIADFGVAVATGARHAALGLARAGRPDFAAPEQITAGVLDARCDLYACGRLGLLLLAHCRETSAAIEAMKDLAMQLSEEEPARRPRSASQALTMLEAISFDRA